jgi:polyphosphate kinase
VSDFEFKPEHFLNRELSWLDFNMRVLEEAQDKTNPLLERVKFLAIFSSNLDEFFMVRVAGLREQAYGDSAPQDLAPDGMRAISQLQRLAARAQQLVAEQYRCWTEEIRPGLEAEGIHLLTHDQLSESQHQRVDKFFLEQAFPILTPMAVDPSHPTPRFHNRGLYLAVTLDRTTGLGPKHLLSVVQLPPALPRFVPVGEGEAQEFILLEDVIAARLPQLFGGFEIQHWTTFRITRDMDYDLLDEEGDDLLHLIEERLRARQRSESVRLEIAAGAHPDVVAKIIEEENLITGQIEQGAYSEIYSINGPIDMTSLFELVKLHGRESLRDPQFTPRRANGLPRRREDMFSTIAHHDILLHHPYDSFDAVVDFVKRAAVDPKVLAIKQTLYRTSGDSPIVKALMEAAENGKQVTALVELKARFDEANNVTWARQMERAGVHVVYGFLNLKTHCKLSLVVRQEGDQLKRYVHLGTGNYHPATALLYTDLGLFTSDRDIANDTSALFNLLTGYSQGHTWKKLIVAPKHLHRRTLDLIHAQTERANSGQPSYIFAKINSLVDPDVIKALYEAGQAGVKIDLVVRGICCLRPGMPGISDNIRVLSIVDRFLEHSRLFVFGPTDDCKIYLASADWMPRNFRRRVEAMVPLEDPDIRARILNEIIPAYLRDNTHARLLTADGTYIRLQPEGEAVHRCQQELLATTPRQPFMPIPPASTENGNGAHRAGVYRPTTSTDLL